MLLNGSSYILYFLFYLVESELCVLCGVRLELFVPVAFEVDGVDQNQPGHVVHHTFGQHILNFTYINNIEPYVLEYKKVIAQI